MAFKHITGAFVNICQLSVYRKSMKSEKKQAGKQRGRGGGGGRREEEGGTKVG
jgi:hypothetical protein